MRKQKQPGAAIPSKQRITTFSFAYHWEPHRAKSQNLDKIGIVCYVRRERSDSRKQYYPRRASMWRLIRMAWHFRLSILKYGRYPRVTIHCKERGFMDRGSGPAADPASWARAGIERSYVRYDKYYYSDFYLANKAIEDEGGNIYEDPPRKDNIVEDEADWSAYLVERSKALLAVQTVEVTW